MNNRQYLTIKQTQRLQNERIDLSGASALWLKLDGERPQAVSKEFADFFFLKESIEDYTLAPALSLSDIMETVLPAGIRTWNNLLYLLTLQEAMTKTGRRYRAGYLLNTVSAYEEGIPMQLHTTGEHDNALDAVYELIMSLLAENKDLFNLMPQMNKEKDIESIKSKILKLHALAESGNTHEAMNARAMLEKWLLQYGLSLDEILEEKNEPRWYEFKARSSWEKKLLFQCYFMVKNVGKVSYRGRSEIISFELTPYEFAEMTNFYEWHRKQLGKELKEMQKNFVDAHVYKHNITSTVGSEREPESLTPEELNRLKNVLLLVRTVEDTHYQKLLEQ